MSDTKYHRGFFMHRLLAFAISFVAAFIVVPGVSLAASIQSVSFMDAEDGDMLRIQSDAALQYQVFELDGPPRLILSFPDASMTDAVSAVKASGAGVLGVVPVAAGKGSRLEVTLSEVLKHSIKQTGNVLTVKFDGGVQQAAKASAAVIKDVSVRDSGSTTELVLRGDHMDSSYNSYLTADGKTMIIDYWGADSRLPKEHYQFSSRLIRDVAIGNADGRVRFVVGLLPGEKMDQQVDVSANELVLRLGGVTPSKKQTAVSVEGVSFQPDDRIAHLLIRTDRSNPVVNVYEKDDHVVVDVMKASLAEGLEQSQDVSAFPGPIRQVDTYKVGEKVRIVSRLRGKVNVTSFQHGNVFTINFEPEDLAVARKGVTGESQLPYHGQKVTFDFKNIDIANAIKLIAEMSNFNIIMSDEVKGGLTMRLVDVPWDQALDIILATRGLGKIQQGNIVRIASLEAIRKENKEALQASQDSRKLEPLVTETIALSFAKAEDIQKMLEASKTVAGKGGSQSDTSSFENDGVMSARGSFIIDSRTNTLIITDTRQALNNVKRLVSIIDKPVDQVMIEARMVEATDDFQRDLGIRWGASYNRANASKNLPGAVAIGGGAGTAQANAIAIQAAGTTATATNRGFLVDLPATTGNVNTLGLSLGAFSNLINLDLELSAAELDNSAKIISSPRVVTANLKPAFIKQGSKLGVVTPGTANNPATTTFVDALLQLQVTPQVTPNDGIIMDVMITKNTPVIVGTTTTIDSKEISTNIYMKSGETVVIGGVYTQDKRNNTSGVPFLSKIPLIGLLFKKNFKQDNKTELLIFLTPKVIHNMDKALAN